MARVTPCNSYFQTTQNLGRVPETLNPQGKVSEKNGESDALYFILSDHTEFRQSFRDTETTRQTVRKNWREYSRKHTKSDTFGQPLGHLADNGESDALYVMLSDPQGKLSERNGESDALYFILSDHTEFRQTSRDTEPTRQTVTKN